VAGHVHRMPCFIYLATWLPILNKPIQNAMTSTAAVVVPRNERGHRKFRNYALTEDLHIIEIMWNDFREIAVD